MCSEMSLSSVSYCMHKLLPLTYVAYVTGFTFSVRQEITWGFICSKPSSKFFDFVPTLSYMYLFHWWDILGGIMYQVQT